MAARLGQTVRVDPRPGADGILAAQAFLSASDPDHTFLVTFGGLLVSNPVTHDKLPYDVSSDFVPVVMLATDTIVICATAEFPAESLGDLVSEMRTRPDAVRWSSAPGEPKLRFLGLLKQIEARPLFVPYKSLNQAVIDLAAGRIEVVVAPLAAVRAQVQSGKLRLLATMAAERSPAAPSVPVGCRSGLSAIGNGPFHRPVCEIRDPARGRGETRPGDQRPPVQPGGRSKRFGTQGSSPSEGHLNRWVRSLARSCVRTASSHAW